MRPTTTLALSAFLALPLSVPAQRGPVPGLNTATPYLIHYGNWDAARITAARTQYRLVILHPSVSNLTPANIATIRSGPDNTPGTSDDVIVLAYISVGEDDRPGAPFAGDGNGPRVDPRANTNEPLEGIDPMGAPSSGGTGFASYYLDDGGSAISGFAFDGQPDQNATFGGYFVNPGDPAWFTIIKTKTKAATGRAGLDELMTTTVGAGYGCDGVFLDTLDTPAPNSFGATLYEWTAPGYQALVRRISEEYPDKILLANRGLFFYNPNLKTYPYTLRPYVNMVMFESYFTDSSGSGAPTAFFDDNKFNFAPKLNAEAGRPDGFTPISLGYTSAGEPPSLGANDFIESQREQGWMLYRTNPSLDSAFNTDAAIWNAANPDTAPPVWDSTAAPGADSDPGTPGNQPPAPRVGLQEAIPGDGQVTLRWDVARDQSGPVEYVVYSTTEPTMDFATATRIAGPATSVPAAYQTGAGPGRYAYETTITGLTNGQTYRFAVRAIDAAAVPNEDANTVTLAATPSGNSEFRVIAVDGSFADWNGAVVSSPDGVDATPVDFANVSVCNDADWLYVRFTLHAPASAFNDFNSHLFIDTDNNPATGFVPGGTVFGSELMIEGQTGYDQRGGGFNEGGVNGLSMAILPGGAATEFELRLSRSAVYATGGAPVFPGRTIRILLQHNGGDLTRIDGIPYTLAATPPPTGASHFATITIDGNAADWATVPAVATDAGGDGIPDIVSIRAANDDDYLYLLVEYAASTDTNGLNGSPSTFFSLDNDATTATGFDIYGLGQVGAEVSWQNDFPFAQAAGNYNLGAVFTGGAAAISPYASNTTFQEYRISRTSTFSIGGGPSQPVFPNNTMRLAAWSDHGGSAEFAGAFLYTFATAPPMLPPGNFASITIDGMMTDWTGIPARATRVSTGAAMDWATLQLANDRNHLYGRITLHTAPAQPPFSEFQTNLFLDTDANAATGFVPAGISLGSSLLVQGGAGYDQRGGGFNEGAVGGLGWQLAGSGTSYEFRIARAASFSGGIPVFTQDSIRLALQDDRPSAPGTILGASGVEYTFQADPSGSPFEAWRAGKFTAGQLADPLVSGPDADPDGDGWNNFAEFTFGMEPLDARNTDAPGLITVTEAGQDHLALRFVRRPDAEGVVYTPEYSGTLAGWDANPALFVLVSENALPDGRIETTIRLAAPAVDAAGFLRVRAFLSAE